MSSDTTLSSALSNAATIVTSLTSGLDTLYHSAVTTVASWGLVELVKLTAVEIAKVNESIQHFVANIQKGVGWGSAMSSLLTEVWNGVQSTVAMLATDFVEAVGKLLQSTGLVTISA